MFFVSPRSLDTNAITKKLIGKEVEELLSPLIGEHPHFQVLTTLAAHVPGHKSACTRRPPTTCLWWVMRWTLCFETSEGLLNLNTACLMSLARSARVARHGIAVTFHACVLQPLRELACPSSLGSVQPLESALLPLLLVWT